MNSTGVMGEAGGLELTDAELASSFALGAEVDANDEGVISK